MGCNNKVFNDVKNVIARPNIKPSDGSDLSANIKLQKRLKVIIRDANTNEILKEEESDKIITNSALNWTASQFATFSENLTYYGWMIVLGTGSGTPSATDTNLFAPVPSTTKGVGASVSSNTVQFSQYWYPWEANGYTYTEVGIFLDTNTNVNSGVSPIPCPYECYDNNGNLCSQCQLFEHGTFSGISKTNSIFLQIMVAIAFT